MKNIRTIFCLSAGLLAASCDLNRLDNYDAPDSALYGVVYDKETGEPVGSDVINGARIQMKQVDYDADVIGNTYVNVKNNGEYRNNMLFKGRYRLIPYERNFIENEPDAIDINGPTEYDFHVTPYLRFRDPSISLDGEKVVATFRLQNNVVTELEETPVSKIALLMSKESAVSNTIRSSSSKVMDYNGTPDQNETMSISINLAAHYTDLKPGDRYFFRLAALSSETGAKYNYSEAVRITIPTLHEEVSDGAMLSDCEALSVSGIGAWTGGPNSPALYGFTSTQGDWCVRLDAGNVSTPNLRYTRVKPVDTGATMDNGVLKFDLYVSDAASVIAKNTSGQIELTSSGKADSQEIAWRVSTLNQTLQDGWNEVALKFSEAAITGPLSSEMPIDLAGVNFFRIYMNGTYPEGFYILVDNLRVCKE